MHTSRKLHDGSTLQKYLKKNIDTKNNITIDISLTTHLARNKSNNHTYNISNLAINVITKRNLFHHNANRKKFQLRGVYEE